MKTIIITLEVNDGNKEHDPDKVKDTAGYFLDEVMNALQDIHKIVVKSVGVEVK
jgi:hypothetical protein